MTVPSVRSAPAHDWDVEAIINRKTFLTRHLRAYFHLILRPTIAWFGRTLTHASLGRPVTNVSAQPTQHLGGLDTEGLVKRWYLLLWRLFGFCQNASHWLQLALSISSQPQYRHMTCNPRPKAENPSAFSHQSHASFILLPQMLRKISHSRIIPALPTLLLQAPSHRSEHANMIQPPHRLLHPIFAECADAKPVMRTGIRMLVVS
jgi:hypothetical protein